MTRFVAKFKRMEVRSRDQFGRLEFEAEADQAAEVAGLLQSLGSPVNLILQADEGDGWAKIGAVVARLTFDGGGRSWVRLTADLQGIEGLFHYVNRVVEVRVE